MSRLELKIPPLALFLVFGGAMWLAGQLTPDHEFDSGFRTGLVALLMAAGAAFGIGGLAGFRRARTTISPLEPEKSASLVTAGVFRYSRNPMYLALVFVLLSWGLALSNLYALALALFYVPYMNRFQIRPEERAMEKRFGEEFRAYRAKVRRWI